MNNNIMRPGEILTVQTNLRAIEKSLGHRVPNGVLDYSILKDRTLRPGEVLVVCQNIRNIEKANRQYTSGNTSIDLVVGTASLLFKGIRSIIKSLS